jgi:hypothetical protein
MIGFAFFVAVVFSVFYDGGVKKKVLHGVRVFAEFVGVALILAWIFYFIPW